MPVSRKEVDDPMTTEAPGRNVASDELLEEITESVEGLKAEVDYIAPSGIEASVIGEIIEVEETEDSVDVRVDASGKHEPYLHVNTSTRDVFFTPGPHVRGDSRLLLYDVKK